MQHRLVLICLFLVLACTESHEKSVSNLTVNELDSSEDVAPDLGEVRRQFVEAYRDEHPIQLLTKDSSYLYSIRHFCLYDSTIRIPARYNFDTQVDFITHNFVTEVIIFQGQDTISKCTITKNHFKSELFPALDSFGVLFPPVCRVQGSHLVLDYSISIPVTDVGIMQSVLVDSAGRVSRIK